MADYPLRPPRTDETPSIAGRPRQPAHYSVTASGKRQGGRTTNLLSPMVGDANSMTPEYKAFMVNIDKIKA